MSATGAIELHAVEGIGRIQPGDDLARIIAEALTNASLQIGDDDVLVVCQKIVSKAEGRIVALASVEPSDEARRFAADFDKDARLVTLALAEAGAVRRMGDGHLITETGPGFVCANSGIDRSNQNGEDEVTLLPLDSDASARRLREGLTRLLGVAPAVLVTDTFGRPWRLGQVDFAIGSAGMAVCDDYEGRADWSGRPLEHTMTATADQLAAAAGLLMGKSDGLPVVVVRGAAWRRADEGAADLVRPATHDLFR